uniref:AttH domain-containing protein n=1 Tax=Magnetococcus massalia (strain MO-1) TaxID=451514 RepID=A0A1S7LER0_MAGMO|nr:Protein of unknown function. Putative secreted hydrolase-like protein [Candidatus Magnetococcus massalia]
MLSMATAPSTAFMAIQVVNYTLFVVLLIYTLRTNRPLFWTMLAGVLMGFITEYQQTTAKVPLYYYTEALVWLPGKVPLGIVLSWGSIFFTLITVLKQLRITPWVAPLLAGLIATPLDLVIDPAFVSLGFWVWNNPSGWFGIPWFNYMGWFVLSSGFIGFTLWAQKHIKPQESGLLWQLIRAFVPIPLSSILSLAIMLPYIWLFQQHHLLPEGLVVAMVLGGAAIAVAWHLPKAQRGNPMNIWSLILPLFLIITALTILVFGNLQTEHPPLVIVMPAFSALLLILLLLPQLDTLLGRASPSVPGGKCNKVTAWALVATLLLSFTVYEAWFAPKKGLIGPVEIPADDAFLPEEDVQWWYWTGHLKTESGREFGFEVVFFAFDSFLIMKDQLVQAAVTDVEGNKFHFREVIELKLPSQLEGRFDLTSGNDNAISAVGGGGQDRLHAEVDNFVLDLDLKQTKPVAMHYGGDAHPYRFGGYTYYYSRTHMETTGTITIDGVSHKVTGTSWFDRQYGALYQAIVKGWQWFAIELDDNRQVMLYDIQGKENVTEQSGSITDAEGNTRTLSRHEFSVKVLDKWKSPHTGCVYPSGWDVTFDGETYRVEPQVKDQELRATHGFWAGPEYWEGTNTVTGPVNGRAYVELNGFCRGVEGTFGFQNK